MSRSHKHGRRGRSANTSGTYPAWQMGDSASGKTIVGAGALAAALVLAGCAPGRSAPPGTKKTTPAMTSPRPNQLPPATTTPETAKPLEQIANPQEFVDAVNQRLVGLAKITESPGVQVEKKSYGTYYFITAPSRDYPGKFDGLLLEIWPGGDIPAYISTRSGLTTDSLEKLIKISNESNPNNIIQLGRTQELYHTSDKNGTFNPDYVEMNSLDPELNVQRFEVSPDPYGAPMVQKTLPPFGRINDNFKFVQTDRASAAKAFDDVLTFAESTLANAQH